MMRTCVVSVTPDTPIEAAARLMLENKIGALPVFENGRDELAGIVTQSDLFEVLARLLGGNGPSTRLEVRVSDLPRPLAAIARLACEHDALITSLVILPPVVRSEAIGLWCGWEPRWPRRLPRRCTSSGSRWTIPTRWCPRRLPMPEPTSHARLVYRPEYEASDFGSEHPLRPVRIHASLDLLSSL
jgi:CBS domain